MRAAPGYRRDGEPLKQREARKQHPERTRCEQGEASCVETLPAAAPDVMPVLCASRTLLTSLLQEKCSCATALVQLAPAAFLPPQRPGTPQPGQGAWCYGGHVRCSPLRYELRDGAGSAGLQPHLPTRGEKQVFQCFSKDPAQPDICLELRSCPQINVAHSPSSSPSS